MNISHFEIFQNTRQNGIQRATKYRITFTKLFFSLYLSCFRRQSYPSISLYSPYFALFVLVLYATLSATRHKKNYGRINKQSFYFSHAFIHFNLAACSIFQLFALLFYSTISFRGAHCLCVCARQSTVLNFYFSHSFIEQLFIHITHTFTRQFSCVKFATDF